MHMATRIERSTRRRTEATIGAGIVGGIALSLALNRISAEWWRGLEDTRKPLVTMTLTFAVVGVATYLAHRYPAAGLWAGGTLVGLVVTGLVIGSPLDVSLSGGGWTPSDMVRFSAYQPSSWACAAAVLAAAFAAQNRR
jgi:hypothetical protein